MLYILNNLTNHIIPFLLGTWPKWPIILEQHPEQELESESRKDEQIQIVMLLLAPNPVSSV